MNKVVWIVSNFTLILMITVFALWQINSHLFFVTPRWVKISWLAVIFYACLVLFETTFDFKVITGFISNNLGLDSSTLRSSAMALWFGYFILINLIYHKKSERYEEKLIETKVLKKLQMRF